MNFKIKKNLEFFCFNQEFADLTVSGWFLEFVTVGPLTCHGTHEPCIAK